MALFLTREDRIAFTNLRNPYARGGWKRDVASKVLDLHRARIALLGARWEGELDVGGKICSINSLLRADYADGRRDGPGGDRPGVLPQ